MKKALFLIALVVLMAGCKTVSVRVKSEDENIKLVVPFFLVKTAVSFSDDQVLEIDDLGGVDQDIDLAALAMAIREDGDKVKFEINEGENTIYGRKVGRVFRVNMNSPDEDVELNLPLALMDRIADAQEKNKPIRTNDLVRALRKYRGVLVSVRSPDETVEIRLN
jgi:hypothetical protein